MLIAALYLIVTNILVARVSYAAAILFYILGLSLIVINIVMVIEAISWYILVKDYARPYFMLGFGRSWPSDENRTLNEITVFRRFVIYTVLSGAVTCSVAAFRLSAFHDISTKLVSEAKRSACCGRIYFVMSTLSTVGYGDIVPESDTGRLIAMLIMLQSFMLLSFLLSVVLSIMSRDR